jgi:hypothetical protein
MGHPQNEARSLTTQRCHAPQLGILRETIVDILSVPDMPDGNGKASCARYLVFTKVQLRKRAD